MRDPQAIIAELGLQSHLEGGHYAETWRAIRDDGEPSGVEPSERHLLGTDLAAGQRPQLIVPAGDWQTAEPIGAWTLVGRTVLPGFRFDGFELAPPSWEPGR